MDRCMGLSQCGPCLTSIVGSIGVLTSRQRKSQTKNISDALKHMDETIQALPHHESAELQTKWEAMRNAAKSLLQQHNTNEKALRVLEKENLGLRTSLEDAQKRSKEKEKEARDLMAQVGNVQGELGRWKKMAAEVETKHMLATRFAPLVHKHPTLRHATKGIDHFQKRLGTLQTTADQADANEVEQEIQNEGQSKFSSTDRDNLQELSCLISDTTTLVSLDKILSRLGPFTNVDGWGTIISIFLENVCAVKQAFPQNIAVTKENEEIETLFNEYLFEVYRKLQEEGNQMHALEKDFEDREKELKKRIKKLSLELSCDRPMKNRGQKEHEKTDAMQKLMDFYSKHIDNVRSRASPISFLEERLDCFKDYMGTRQQEYISELSQHDDNIFKKRELAKQVKEWSEEKNKTLNQEKMHARWCEITAQVLQQDATNSLMISLSSFVTCTRWTICARIGLDQEEQTFSCALKFQTSMAKQLCADEQVYQGAHDRAKRGSELLLRFRDCIEKAYTELIHKSKCDEHKFHENLPEYEKRLSTVRKSLSAELLSRRDHFQRLLHDSTVQKQQLEAELVKMEYANLSDDEAAWDETMEKLKECEQIRDSYEKQYEHINQLVIASSPGHLTIEDSGDGELPDSNMQDWLEQFHFNRPGRRQVVLPALTDAFETCSLPSGHVISLDGEHCGSSTEEVE